MGMNDNAQEFLSANQVSVDLLGVGSVDGFSRGLKLCLSTKALCESALLGRRESPRRRSELAADPAAAKEQRRMRLVRGEGCACVSVLLRIARAQLSHSSPVRQTSLRMEVQLVFLDAVRFPSIVCSSGVSFPHVEYFL